MVRRLDSGHILHQLDSTTGPVPVEGFQSVDSIVVKADGAVAWIVKVGSIVRPESETELNRVDRRGEATLTRSANLNASSLKLRGSQLAGARAAGRVRARSSELDGGRDPAPEPSLGPSLDLRQRGLKLAAHPGE